MSEESVVDYRVGEGVATITLNRPEKRNAFGREMQDQLVAWLAAADTTDAVRVIIITGAGESFCVGADLSGGSAAMRVDGPEWRDGGGQVALRLFQSRKPVIAAINGAAVGVGITMTLPMDIRIASQTARFGFPFARRGIVPEACSTWFLPRIVGIAQALEWVMTGRVFGAEEALDCGLVREVVPPDRLLPRACEIASQIVENCSGVSIALARQMLWRMSSAEHPMEAHRIETRAISALARAPDAAEGFSAFLEKRSPKFPMQVSSDTPALYPWFTEPEF